MNSVFKAYDIRGIYGTELTDELAFEIGRAFVTFVKCRKVVIGRDMRPHSAPLFENLCRGITMQGADVVDLGLASTPMSYFANGLLQGEGGIMITASHNTGEYNGFKLSRAGAVPISGSTGIKEIEAIVKAKSFAPAALQPGKVTPYDIFPEYAAHVAKLADFKRPVRVAIDVANSMGLYEARALSKLMSTDVMFETLDGTFPNHEANPLVTETLEPLIEKIQHGQYDFGVAFDGDADRAGFVDEKGNAITMDVITALIAEDLLRKEPGAIFYDLRSSWAVKEVIQAAGGKPMMSRVGHAFFKEQMRQNNAIFAGELSGHYYFRANYFTESSSMAVICLANIVSRSSQPLSELVKPIQRYFASGEINSRVSHAEKILETLKKRYADGKLIMLDGVSVEFADWWFNVRTSNTEPLIRLNVEARSRDQMEQKRDELLAIIRG
jgi:phosphomannomutase